MRTTEVARMASVSYRQLDYWRRNGLFGVEGSGSGHSIELTRSQARTVEKMGLLVNVAKMDWHTARQLVEDGEILLGDGLVLRLERQ